jgi:hypothetical protein
MVKVSRWEAFMYGLNRLLVPSDDRVVSKLSSTIIFTGKEPSEHSVVLGSNDIESKVQGMFTVYLSVIVQGYQTQNSAHA